MARKHLGLIFALTLVLACGGAKSRSTTAPSKPAPYVGFSTTPGPTGTLMGTSGELSGKQFWLSTNEVTLPRVGAYGELSWTLDRNYGPFGKGVIMGMGEVQVKQVQTAPAGMTQQILLEITRGDGGISFNGVPVNVVTPGKRLKLTYRL